MNYEELYTRVQAHEKEISDMLSSQQKLFKRMAKSLEKGDLKSAVKDLALLQGVQTECVNAAVSMDETLSGFDAAEYMQSGNFAEQMLQQLEKSGIDAKGEHNVYEVFPYKIKLDTENLDIYIDRKRVQCLRPLSLVNEIKSGREKLMSASFNPSLFANELAIAYDTAIAIKSRSKPVAADTDFYLTDLYKQLTPMKRFRRDYDIQNFAFDLARLHNSEVRAVDDGRMFQFGPSRNNNKAIRVLSEDGNERFLATIRFYNE